MFLTVYNLILYSSCGCYSVTFVKVQDYNKIRARACFARIRACAEKWSRTLFRSGQLFDLFKDFLSELSRFGYVQFKG